MGILENDISVKALRIESHANKKLTNLLQCLSGQTDLIKKSYAYKLRVKSEAKLIEKVRLKKAKKTEYDICDITDVIGLRFITLFRYDMPAIVYETLSLVCGISNVNRNPFLANSVEEVIVYTGNVSHDSVADEIVKIAEQSGIDKEKIKKESSKEGYSSVHIVARLSEPVELDSNGSPDFYIPIEVQIRTVFEDAWGEIDHKYGYVVRESKTTQKINNPASVLAHLKVLKKFSDACADYADVIHREAIEDLTLQPSSGIVMAIEVEDEDDIKSRFSKIKIPEYLINQYSSAIALKEAAIKSRGSGSDGNSNDFIGAAQAFREIEPSIDGANFDPLFFYYVKMNEAFCLLSSEMNDEIHAAKEIYRSLLDKFERYPLIYYRLGQVYNKIGLIPEAVDMYSIAWDIIVDCKKNSLIGSKELPKNDYEHISARLKKLWGYNLWQLAQKEIDPEKSYGLINNAYSLTVEGLEDAIGNDAILSIHNNALYYLVEIIDKHEQFCDKEDTLNKSKAHLAYLENKNVESNNHSLEHLDTLTKAYYFHDDFEKAKIVSQEVIKRVLAGNHKSVSDSVALKMVRDANEILAKMES